MKSEPAISPLRSDLLRSVSRSFYLSIRILPERLRDPVALAYLLARATDTLADTAEISAAIRAEQLGNLARVIAGESRAEDVGAVRDAFAPRQTNAAERALILALPDCINWLDAMELADRDDIRAVLAEINAGQALDVARFSARGETRALATSAELERYTYLVAGSVGEFWTKIGARHLPHFASAPQSGMLQLGKSYGTGLQLINILRDLGSDLRAGRCYLPREQLDEQRITPDKILREPRRIEPLLAHWRARARAGIEDGIEYACAIRNRRVRFATALPGLIGARTIALLENAGAAVLEREVKVTRPEVRAIIRSGALTFASERGIRRMFARFSDLKGSIFAVSR